MDSLHDGALHHESISRSHTRCRQSSLLQAATVTEQVTEVESPPLEKIKKGFLKFKEYYKKEQALFKQLAESQHPKFMIIACADSRVDPCTILGLGLGEAFVVRNVANMVPSYTQNACSSTASAIEYAVLHLKVEHLMVIGHSRCGGIKALMGMKEDGSNRFSEFIEDWVVVAKGASRKVKLGSSSFEEQCASCEKEAVNLSLWNCLSFPFVRETVAAGKLSLHGGYYDFVNGSFERWSVDFNEVSNLEKFE